MATKQWLEQNVDKLRSYRNDWYEKNKESEREKAKIRQKQRRKDFNDWYYQYKSTLCCVKCGFSHPAALDFHHRDKNEKDFNPSEMRTNTNKKKFLTEIEKCDVLCANCHRILHYEENKNGSMV